MIRINPHYYQDKKNEDRQRLFTSVRYWWETNLETIRNPPLIPPLENHSTYLDTKILKEDIVQLKMMVNYLERKLNSRLDKKFQVSEKTDFTPF